MINVVVFDSGLSDSLNECQWGPVAVLTLNLGPVEVPIMNIRDEITDGLVESPQSKRSPLDLRNLVPKDVAPQVNTYSTTGQHVSA